MASAAKTVRKKPTRRESGAQIPEFAAAIALVLPIFIAIIYLAYEACMYVYLKTGVDAAARTEARWLAINFNYLAQENGDSASTYSTWKNSKVRVSQCVVSNAQFTNGTIDSTGKFVTTAPDVVSNGGCITSPSGRNTVAVQVIYPGDTGLPDWPNPPIKLFGMNLTPNNLTISSVYVADIEP
ncbi:MAG TPA: TadE family protein [Planktothrix sp.]|jgi:Flp pilus assembly protein TadG